MLHSCPSSRVAFFFCPDRSLWYHHGKRVCSVWHPDHTIGLDLQHLERHLRLADANDNLHHRWTFQKVGVNFPLSANSNLYLCNRFVLLSINKERLPELTITVLWTLYRLKHKLWFFFVAGMVMATSTAALQCCLMDSSSAGAWICASTLAGCLSGTEGEGLQWLLWLSFVN